MTMRFPGRNSIDDLQHDSFFSSLASKSGLASPKFFRQMLIETSGCLSLGAQEWFSTKVFVQRQGFPMQFSES